MDQNVENYYKVLIHSYLSGQANDKDIESLMLWIEQSDDNRKLFIDFKRIWELTLIADQSGKFSQSKYEEWEKVSKELHNINTYNNKSLIQKSTLERLIRIAAIVFLFISIGATIAWITTSNKLNNYIHREIAHVIIVPKGSRNQVILPDSTAVWLNAGTTMRYSGSYGLNDRTVYLEGEGYFSVKKNKDVPFIVEACGLKIKALGTEFNVKAYAEENSLTTTLVEGTVKIEGKGVNLTLNPRQKITYIKNVNQDDIISDADKKEAPETNIPVSDKSQIHGSVSPEIDLKSSVNTQEFTSWKDDRLILNGEKLSNISVLLERKFNVTINIQDEEVRDTRFTGTFYQETLEQLLNIINMTAPIKYQIKDGIVTIQVDNKRKKIYREISN